MAAAGKALVDGRSEPDLHADISTEEGQKISLKADGISLPGKDSSISDLKEYVTWFSSYINHSRMHTPQVWRIGTVDLAIEITHVKGYSARLPLQLVHVQGGNGFMIQIKFNFPPELISFICIREFVAKSIQAQWPSTVYHCHESLP